MSTSQTAEPPAEEAGEAFDAAAYAAHLSKPKQHHAEQAEHTAQNDTPEAPAPAPESPAPDSDPDEDEMKRYRRRAKTYVTTYNRFFGGLGAFMAGNPDKYPAERFMLGKDEQDEAIDSVAQGMYEKAIPEAPWYLPLVAVVGVQVADAGSLVMQARKEKKAQDEAPKQAAQPARPGPGPVRTEQPVTVASEVVHEDGTTTPLPKPRSTGKAPKPKGGPCHHAGCHNLCARKGGKYCSKAHADANQPGRKKGKA